jgi:hypothetical protein
MIAPNGPFSSELATKEAKLKSFWSRHANARHLLAPFKPSDANVYAAAEHSETLKNVA